MNLPIVAHIDGRATSREEVQAWERKRAEKVARLIGVADRSNELERRLVERKLELGHDRIEQLLGRRLIVSDRVGRSGAAISRGRRRRCTIELTSPAGVAEVVPSWFSDTMAENDELPLIAASPDHFLFRTNADGSQEFIETTGGSPLPIRMFFGDTDATSIVTKADPDFPAQWVSVARVPSGALIGGVRHEFRDYESGGFRARLTVEFPLTTPHFMIASHRWHLACEFSNWIEAVNR